MDCLASPSKPPNSLEHFAHSTCFLLKGCEIELGLWASLIFFSNTCSGGGRVEMFYKLPEKVAARSGAAISGSFWHHLHLVFPEGCMDFFLSCAYPNNFYQATQGASKQLKPWSIASHVQKKGVTLGLVLIS